MTETFLADGALRESGAAEIDAAVREAAAAAAGWAATDGATRGRVLRAIAAALEAAREHLVPIADAETGLGSARLNGELDRTAFQLRAFADAVEAGDAFAFVEDAAVAGAPPAGRPRLRRVRQPLGPVAMFSASNFPFAFSVLGGDTASALAAGCPVVVKAHPGHPKLSAETFALASAAIAAEGLPAGLLRMIQGASVEVGVTLVQHPAIDAVAFTGSVRGGLALEAVAQRRPRPIPFFGELGAINPVVALPAAIARAGADLAKTLAGSIAQGCGQFCTNPGLIVALKDEATDGFVARLAEAVAAQTPHRMLTAGMRAAFDAGTGALRGHAAVRVLATGQANGASPAPMLFETDAAAFIADAHLREEVFGPCSLIVRVDSEAQIPAVLEAIGGSLTASVWGADEPTDAVRAIVRAAMRIAGRVLFAGVPTGVAVTRAQLHGGPYPASTRPETTSVGLAAMDRFLRPVALQDAPAWLDAQAGRPV